VADQREHGTGGLEWRRSPIVPDEPLVPSTDVTGHAVDETAGVSAFRGGDIGVGDDRGDRAQPGDPDGPIDLSALRADDELLTALCSFDNSVGSADQDPELKSLLLSWRLDVDAEPIAELVDTDTAMAAIAAGTRTKRRKPRYLVPLASAAAVLVVVFSGMGLAARDAQPGDTLWGLSQVLYSDHARSVEAAAQIRTELSHASDELNQGHFSEARTALAQAMSSLPAVDSADGKADLAAQQQVLLNQLDATTTTGVPPLVSSSTLAGAPAPPGDPTETTQDSSETTTTQSPPTTTTTDPPTTTTTTTTDPPTTTTTDSVSPQSSTVSEQDLPFGNQDGTQGQDSGDSSSGSN
jgi:hypothetical protein